MEPWEELLQERAKQIAREKMEEAAKDFKLYNQLAAQMKKEAQHQPALAKYYEEQVKRGRKPGLAFMLTVEFWLEAKAFVQMKGARERAMAQRQKEEARTQNNQ
jgi:hypothetical protein